MSRYNITILKSLFFGLVAASSLIVFYLGIVSFISGWQFAKDQFSDYWYFLLSLALGFGVQIGLYAYLKQEIKNHNAKFSGKSLAVTGTTSTLSMISCCAHYLANIIPVLGITGALTIISQYQIQSFRVGLLFNVLGIAYMASKVVKFKKHLKVKE